MLKSSQAAAGRKSVLEVHNRKARKSWSNWITNNTIEIKQCSKCGGTGKGGFFSSYCKGCSGSGSLRVVPCPKCHGSGKGIFFNCRLCSGYGKIIGDMASLLSLFISR